MSDDQTEDQIKDRLALMRFLGLGLEDRVADAKTIWLLREQLTRAGAGERPFRLFASALRDAGYLAMSGQIGDATMVQARRPRLSKDEKAAVKDGGVPSGWSQAKRAQMDTDGRWTRKRGRKRGEPHEQSRSELVIPVFGYKNQLGIDRRHGFIRTFTVTDAAAHDGRQLGRRLDPENTASSVWADTAYRAAANLSLLARRGLMPQFQRPKPRGKPMPPHRVRGHASRARVRVAVAHVFAAQKCRLGLVVRSVGLARATARLGLAHRVTNMRRRAWFGTRLLPA